MNQKFTRRPHGLTKTQNLPKDPEKRTEQMLREIAFVLKMTEKIRHDIDVNEEAYEPAMA